MLHSRPVHHQARLIVFADLRRRPRRRRDEGIERTGNPPRIGCRVFVGIARQLVFEPASAGLPARCIRPFVDALNEIFQAGITIPQNLPFELQLEGTVGILATDVLEAAFARQSFDRTVLYLPTVRGEGLTCDLLPSFGGPTVEEQAPTLPPLG